MFTRAIVKKPSTTFAQGLTTASLGMPDLERVYQQHNAYCEALQRCGLEVFVLEADDIYPDSTFVEDTAVLTPKRAVLTNPGAQSRKGEVTAIRPAIESFYEQICTITAPGTLDGGDICETDEHFFIGISERTNEEGGRQLAKFLSEEGYTSSFVDVRDVSGILHLKSGISYIGDGNLVLIEELAGHEAFKSYNILKVQPQENYAANCVRVNDYILLPSAYPRLAEDLQKLGYPLLPLDMSEFEKMDGGLSCLSLRF